MSVAAFWAHAYQCECGAAVTTQSRLVDICLLHRWPSDHTYSQEELSLHSGLEAVVERKVEDRAA